jgi:outer membrane protein TolC
VSVARQVVAAAVPLALAAASARAQVGWPMPVEDPVLASLIEEALSKNPDLVAAREAALAAEQRPAQARSLPNPMFSTIYTNDGWPPSLGTEDMTTLAFMGSQELPFSGKRRLRGDIASREAGQVRYQTERVRRRLTATVKRAYYGLVLTRHFLELVHDQEDILTQIEAVARARYAVGQGAQQDVLRVQVEVSRIEGLRAEQEGEAEIRLAELNRLLARPGEAPLETAARLTLRPLQAELDQLLEWAGAASPEVKGATIGMERAALAIELAKKEYKPDFSVEAAYMSRGGLDPMWQAGIGVTLPVYRKRLAAGVAEAEAQVRAIQGTCDSLKLQVRFRTRERLTQLKTAEKLATLYDQGIVPQDRMSVEAALANYQTGKVPFISVLEALMTLYNDRATHLRLLANHELTLASLEELSLDSTSGLAGAGVAAAGSGMSGATSGGTGSPMSGSGMGSR